MCSLPHTSAFFSQSVFWKVRKTQGPPCPCSVVCVKTRWCHADLSSFTWLSVLVIARFFRCLYSETTQFLILATLSSWGHRKKKMWVLWGDTSHLFPSVTDSFPVVTLKGPDIQSGWASITGFLLLSCSGGRPAWFHPSEAFRHALHCCVSVLRALQKWDYMIYLALLPLFTYHWGSPCGVCPHNKDQLQMSAPNARLSDPESM